MSNPFSQFKPYAKHPTSEWPLFSHWLDDNLDLATAPVQYSVYLSWAMGFGWTLWHIRRYKTLEKLIPDSVVSDMNKHALLDKLKSQRTSGVIFPVVTTFMLSMVGAQRRNEEVDRSGDRFREYFSRATYCGLEDAAALAFAREIVLRSSTREEGEAILVRGLTRLQDQGVIPKPQYTTDGGYVIPPIVQQQELLKKIDSGDEIQTKLFVPGNDAPIDVLPALDLDKKNAV